MHGLHHLWRWERGNDNILLKNYPTYVYLFIIVHMDPDKLKATESSKFYERMPFTMRH